MHQIFDAAWELAKALREAEKVEFEAQQAEQRYEELLLEFEKQHPETVQAKNAASLNQTTIKLKVKTLRAQLSELATGDKYDQLPEGVKQTRERTPKYHHVPMRQWLFANMPAFLMINVKALDKFLLGVADELGNLPSYLLDLDMPAEVALTYKASISDKGMSDSVKYWHEKSHYLREVGFAPDLPKAATIAATFSGDTTVKALLEAITGQTMTAVASTPAGADVPTETDDDVAPF